MEDITEFIHRQFAFNQNRNLYYSGIGSSTLFTPEVSTVIHRIKTLNPEEEQQIIEYTSEKALEEFGRFNQYYSFSDGNKLELKNIYSRLFLDLKQYAENTENQIEPIAKKHYKRLKEWLEKTNSFSSKIYDGGEEFVSAVVCSEYPAELQLKILNIEFSECQSPVLDIGCGKAANLLNVFRQHGIEAFGIERFDTTIPFCKKANWLEFDYGINKWGTIISHLGFSNHFNHHHLRIDGNFREYATVYMSILKSLKPGGSFIYTPDLPFIEQYLDKTIYSVTKTESGTNNFKTSRITLLK